MGETYPEARRLPIRATGPDTQTFTSQCPFSALETLDDDFYPNPQGATHPTPDPAGSCPARLLCHTQYRASCTS
ncbi:hypothetical protein [Thiohalocapsa halophila]|uniref:hypothetical protein n=1 Tax=Thiohalocapsa halophila TaxID=69359 RepID=UPI001905A400